MITKGKALEILLAAAPPPLREVSVPLFGALERVLSRDIVSDVSMPPFPRSSMDGWAVRASDVQAPGVNLRIVGRIMAGTVPERAIGPGETMKIMTGAPVPEGADAVVMVEQSEELPGERVRLTAGTRPGANISPAGEDVLEGETVLRRGTWLDPSALALLATVGAEPVPTFAVPSVAVIPTGDELVVPSGPRPGPGMIRESNGTLLATQVSRVSRALAPVRPGIARDTHASIDLHLDVGLGHDVLCLSGGVSMGDLDLVGDALVRRGLEVLIEKVSIKPGKPLLFGRLQGPDGHVCHVFGLPGNPVSSFVTFELFVRPFLLASMGRRDVEPDVLAARLVGERSLRGIPRTQHVPAVCTVEGSDLVVRPVTWHGSGDLRGLVGANALVVLEIDAPEVSPGEQVLVHLIPGCPLVALPESSRPVGAP